MSGAHRRTSRASLVLLQLLVFVTYIFGPTATFAEDPLPEPTPTESVAPEPSSEPITEPPLPPTVAPATPAPSVPEPTTVPSDPAPSDPAPSESDPTTSPEPATLPYLITFAPGTGEARQLEILGSAGATDVSAIPQLAMRSILLQDSGFLAQLDQLSANVEVVRVEADRTRDVEAAPSDSSYADQWSLPQIGWDQLYGSVGIAGSATVAVLDTGVDAWHPDLDGVVLAGTSVLDGSNGLTDPNGHGTWMAGIVAAETDNAYGIAGTAYAGVSILPVTVLGADGTGQDSDIIAGVVYAADAGADVILMSFSNPGYSPALQAAIDYAWDAGAVLVAATGNDGSGSATFPAGDRGVIGVASTDASDVLAPSSNHGPAAFMAAPGVSIATTAAGGDVATISGTSAAAASVAGAAALLSANEPFLSNGVIVGRLARNADPAGDPAATGNGRLNLARAMADASTESVQPAGAAPVGGGGPLVGPYVVAAPSIFVDVAPTYSPGSSTRSFSVLVENTASSSSSNNYMGCIEITLPANYSVAAAGNFTDRAVDAGKVWATPTVFAVSGQNRGIRWIADANGEQRIADGEWSRLTFAATVPATSTANWSIRANNNINCGGQNDTVTQAVLVGAIPTRTYSTTIIGPSTLTPGVPVVLQARMIRTGNMNIESGVIALPACVTVSAPTIVTNADSLNKGDDGSDWSVEVNDGVLRTTKGGGTQLDAVNTYVQVQFTATASVGCAAGTHAVLTSAMNNPWREGTNDVNKVIVPQGGTHPTVTVAAANTAPSVAANNASVTVDEGQEAANTGTWSDSNAGDTVTVSASVGTVTKSGTNAAGAWSWSYDTTDGPDDGQTVTITANDGTTSTSTSFVLTVANLDPVVILDGPAISDEGDTQDYTFSITDAGADTFTVDAADCGANGVQSLYAFDGVDGSFSCTWSDNYLAEHVSLDVSDDDGGSDSDSISVDIANLDPIVTLSGDSPVNEGSTHTYSYTVGDAGADTFVLLVEDCDGGTLSSNLDFNPADGSGSFECTFPDGLASHNVNVTVDDDDAGSDSDTLEVTVNNVKPSIVLTGDATVDEGDTKTYSFVISDPGQDTHTLTTSCGLNGDKVSETYNPLDGMGTVVCFFADGPTSTNVTATVVDSDGAADTDNQVVIVTVNNVAPLVTLTGAASADEGDTISYSYSTIDPGDEVFTLDAETCDGGTLSNSNFNSVDGSGSFECTFADNGTYHVSVTVGDGFEADSDTVEVTVANLDPVVTLSGPNTSDEGDTQDYTFSITDAGADTFTVDAADCGANGVQSLYAFDGVDGSFSCTWSDNYLAEHVSLDVSDDDGGSDSDSISVDIANVAPSIAISGAASVNEGSSYSLTLGAVTDPGSDTVTSYIVHWGDGNSNTYMSNGVKGHTYADGPNSYAITVDLIDEDGTHLDRANVHGVMVTNVAPSIAISGALGVNEGSSYDLTLGAVTDPGTDTITSYIVHWGDGNTDTYTSDGVKTHTYADGPNTHAITVDLVDEDGTHLDRANAMSVAILNVAPTIDISGAASVNEGSSYSLTLGVVTDPGSDTVTGYTVHWGDGNSDTYGTDGVKTHTYADGPNTHVITVDLVDEDGTHLDRANAMSVAILNVVPTIAISGAASVNEGSSYSLTLGALTDPGTDTVSSYFVHWGDGATDTYTSNGVKTHFYANGPATRAITVDLIDEDGTYLDRANALSVTVNNVPPETANPTFTYDPVSGVATAGFTFSDPGWLDNHSSTFTWTIDGSPTVVNGTDVEEHVAPDSTGSSTSTFDMQPGCHTITVTGRIDDHDGGVTTQPIVTGMTSVDVYLPTFDAPIKNNERNIAKYGNVVPVKVRLASSCTGVATNAPNLYITVAQGVTTETFGDEVIVTSSNNADSGTQMMRTPDTKYMYNLSTKGFQPNTNYEVRIRVGSTTGPIIAKAVLYPKK